MSVPTRRPSSMEKEEVDVEEVDLLDVLWQRAVKSRSSDSSNETKNNNDNQGETPSSSSLSNYYDIIKRNLHLKRLERKSRKVPSQVNRSSNKDDKEKTKRNERKEIHFSPELLEEAKEEVQPPIVAPGEESTGNTADSSHQEGSECQEAVQQSRPGAYRFGPRGQRESASNISETEAGPLERTENDSPQLRRSNSSARVYMAEANLVVESEELEPSLLVEAKLIRRKRQAVAILALLVIVGIVVGATTATVTSSKSTKTPTTMGTVSNIPGNTSDPACSTKQAVFDDCLSTEVSLRDRVECNDCVNAAFSYIDKFKSCDDLEVHICDVLNTCTPCGGCSYDLELFFQCEFKFNHGCNFDCGVPNKPVNATQPRCNAKQAVFDDCLSTEISDTDVAVCKDCISAAYIYSGKFNSCDDLEAYTCDVLNNCAACGSCSYDLELFFQCEFARNHDCNFDCGVPNQPVNVTQPRCSAKQAIFNDCLSSEISINDGDQCSDCISAAHIYSGKFKTCDALEVYTCDVLRNCTACGDCTYDLESLHQCQFARDHGCNLDCGVPNSPETAVKLNCNSEQSAFDDCLFTEISIRDGSQCNDCISAANIYSGKFNKCDDLKNYTCDVLSSCTTCGRCIYDLELLFQCQFERDNGCNLDCGVPNKPVNASEPSCDAKLAVFEDCQSTGISINDLVECDDCISAANIYSGKFKNCDDLKDYTCDVLSSCTTCGRCIYDLEGFFQCEFARNHGCNIDCGVPNKPVSASEPSCDAKLAVFEDCQSTEISINDLVECDDCISTANIYSGKFDSCADLEVYTCDSLNTCTACGSCRYDLEEFFQCEFARNHGCNLYCDAVKAPTYPTAPSVAPTVGSWQIGDLTTTQKLEPPVNPN